MILICKEIREGLLPVSEILGSSPLRQASENQISLRWAPGAAFWNPWKPDLPCLSGFLLVTLSWVGSCELAFSKSLKIWSALPVRFSPSWPCHGWDLVCHLPAISFRIDFSIDLLRVQGTQEPSPTQFKSINSLALSFLYGPTLTSIHDYWKNHSFD